MLVILALALLAGYSQADEIGPPAFSPSPPSDKPFGAYYCQARCLASCIETFLAPTLEECEKFCPPFEESMPCPPDNAQCWMTCGVPVLPSDPSAPESPIMTPVILGIDQEQDPFAIELTWTAVPNASLYIVEFFPHNRAQKQGESNFFQVMTTSLTYKVRKEDECVEYSGRVIAVNSYGISTPTYAFIGAPIPSVGSADHFAIRSMQRDPWTPGMVTVTIDYTFPAGWPIDDIDIDSIRVSALDCQGPLGDRSFGSLVNPPAVLNPSYDAIIGKSPTTAIQLSFFDDMPKSDCLIQMRLAALTTRCNTSASFEENISTAPGIDFRINCDTVADACETDNNTDSAPVVLASPVAPAIPTIISVDPEVIVPPLLNTPGHMPPGVDNPEEVNTTDSSSDMAEMPTPPPLPLFIIGESNQDPDAPQPIPSGGRVSVIDISPNGTDMETMEVIPQTLLPPLCELEMIDVQPVLSQLSTSLIDMKVMWLERQVLPAPPPPTYFAIRYGPIIRRLVDDDRQPTEIIPGYESITRTVQSPGEMPFLPDPVREINISTIQRGSLLKIQICAIFDPVTEPLIQWEDVHSRRIDLAALEPFLDFEDNQPQSMDMDPTQMQTGAIDSPVLTPDAPSQIQSISDETVDVPLLIAVNVESKTNATTYWMSVIAALLLIILTLMLILVFLRRMCGTRRHMYKIKDDKPMMIVSTVPHKLTINETVKVPLP